MWMLFSLTLLTAVTPDGASMAADAERAPAAVRSGRELDRAVHDALRCWAKPTGDRLEPAAREFLSLYEELQRDTDLARSTQARLSTKVRSRLADLARRLSRQAAAKKKLDEKRPESVDGAGRDGFLAQRGGQFGGRGPARGAMPRPQGLSPNDAGQELVDLIQRTIAPKSWARNGGPGTIYYWRPGRALVARAPAGVHDHIGEFLRQMDRLGR